MRILNYIYVGLVLFLLAGCASAPEQADNDAALQEQEEIQDGLPAGTAPVSEQVAEDSGEIKITDDIKEILEKGKTRLKSYSYHYKTPEINDPYEIYIKGEKIKIVYPQRIYIGTSKKNIFYNTVYLDTEKKTAEAYCIGYSKCLDNDGTEDVEGKVADLVFEEEYIETPIDWLAKVTEAEKIDERRIENRDCIYLESDIGKITVETYYGFLYKIEKDDGVIEFKDAALNSIGDEEVTPS